VAEAIRAETDPSTFKLVSSPAQANNARNLFGVRIMSSATVFYGSTVSERPFANATDALTAAKFILARRNKEDQDFIEHLVYASIADFNGAPALCAWIVAFICFARENTDLVFTLLDQAKRLSLPLDIQFLLFALRQKQIQGIKSANVGGDLVSAIGLIELTKEQEAASTHHLDSIRHLRKFWAVLSAQKDSADPSALTRALDEFHFAFLRASNSYSELAVKFPNSAQLLFAYAEFQESVANDTSAAAELRARAELLEDRREVDVERSEGASSSNRAVQRANEQRWKEVVLTSELSQIEIVYKRIRCSPHLNHDPSGTSSHSSSVLRPLRSSSSTWPYSQARPSEVLSRFARG
jgi:hypothetical protein